MSDNEGVGLDELERGPSAKFEEIGDSHTGTILRAERKQQTDINTGELLFWNDGSKREQTEIEIKPDDGDPVTLYARGGKFTAAKGTGLAMEPAIVAAVRAAGDDRIRPGARLTVTHTGLSKPSKVGFSPARLYTATYERVEASVPIAGLFSEG